MVTPPFQNILDDVFTQFDLPPHASSKAQIKDDYRRLCSYSHKPIPGESLTRIRGTNRAVQSASSIETWFRLLHGVSVIILDLLITQYPMCLHPVVIYRKFGFSPPAGLFFDRIK